MPTFAAFVRECKDALLDPARREIVLAALKVKKRVTPKEALADYLRHKLSLKKHRENTSKNQAATLGKFFRTVRVKYVDQLTCDRIQDHILERAEDETSPKTLRNLRNEIHGFLGWAVGRKYVGTNVADGVEAPRKKPQEIVFIALSLVPVNHSSKAVSLGRGIHLLKWSKRLAKRSTRGVR